MKNKYLSFFKLNLFLFFLGSFFVFNVFSVFALSNSNLKSQTDAFRKSSGYEEVNDSGNVYLIVAQIINVILGFLGIIFLCLILYAGFKWMMARGDSKETGAALDTIKNATIGLIIVISAYAISNFIITKVINRTQGFSATLEIDN